MAYGPRSDGRRSFTIIVPVRCGGPVSIVMAREDIIDSEGAIREGPGSGELAYDEGEPADDSPLGEIVWRRDFSF
jgi:hypothetical protein